MSLTSWDDKIVALVRVVCTACQQPYDVYQPVCARCR